MLKFLVIFETKIDHIIVCRAFKKLDKVLMFNEQAKAA